MTSMKNITCFDQFLTLYSYKITPCIPLVMGWELVLF